MAIHLTAKVVIQSCQEKMSATSTILKTAMITPKHFCFFLISMKIEFILFVVVLQKSEHFQEHVYMAIMAKFVSKI